MSTVVTKPGNSVSESRTASRPPRGHRRKHKRAKPKRTPARNFKRKLGRGDWIVQQLISRHGTNPDQHENLVKLGLGQIGRTALFDRRDRSAWGQIEKVQHLVAARPLTYPLESHDPYFRPAMSKPEAIPYEVGGREARHYDFDGDSFLSIEPYGDSFALNWSTALPIATVLERIAPELVGEVKRCTVFDPAVGRQRELKWKEALPILRSGRADYPFVRLESADVVFVWQRPAYPNHVDEDVGAGRIGLVCQRFVAAALTQAMHDTATPPLGEHVEELMSDVAVISAAEAA